MLEVNVDSNLKEFAKNLELIKMNSINFLFYEMLPLCGFGTAIAYSKFLAMQKKISFGSYALINAYKKEHIGLWGEVLKDPLWERSMYFENAVESYSTMIDYIYSVIYFNFDLYKIIDNYSIVCKEDVLKISKSVKGKTIGKIDTWLADETSTKEFFIDFASYNKATENLRDLANDIKHRGCIAVEGMDLPRVTKVTKKIDGVDIDMTDVVASKVINLDQEILKLVEVHRSSLDIQKKLYYLCGFKEKLINFGKQQGLEIDI